MFFLETLRGLPHAARKGCPGALPLPGRGNGRDALRKAVHPVSRPAPLPGIVPASGGAVPRHTDCTSRMPCCFSRMSPCSLVLEACVKRVDYQMCACMLHAVDSERVPSLLRTCSQPAPYTYVALAVRNGQIRHGGRTNARCVS